MSVYNFQKNKMPLREPKERVCDFQEVSLGYSAETAINEAARCLRCKNPSCMNGCPVHVHIPDFLNQAANGCFENAYQIIAETSAFPAICGRVCPQEKQCEEKCIRAFKGESVAIGRVERFVADWHRTNEKKKTAEILKRNGHKAAVIGSGPGGLACAADLAHAGVEVTVFEALHEEGGVLTYGIPEFRLPKTIVRNEVENLRNIGVQIQCDVIIGKTLIFDDLRNDGYECFFIASGAGLPRFMNIPGENLCGVSSANEYLTRINLMKAYHTESMTPVQKAKQIIVVGGGNVAMDAARCALRMGAEKVTIVYRRGMSELPARAEEVEHAIDEGVQFETLCAPIEIEGDKNGNVIGIRCIRMKLGEPDSSGRRRPVEINGSEFLLPTDMVIMAIGTSPNPLLRNAVPELECDSHGCIRIFDEYGKTSIADVFAGGDAVTGAATVIQAMGAGKKAASGMLRYMNINC